MRQYCALIFCFNLRSPGSRFGRNEIISNPYILAALLFCAGLLAAAVYAPFLGEILKTRQPDWRGWLLVAGMSGVPFIWGQILRAVQHR